MDCTPPVRDNYSDEINSRSTEENVFDLVELKIKRKRKTQKKVLSVECFENVEEVDENIKTKEGEEKTLLDFEGLKAQIQDFEFDENFIYDFNGNKITKIKKTTNYHFKIPIINDLEIKPPREASFCISNSHLEKVDISKNIKRILKTCETLDDYNKILLLEEFIGLKDQALFNITLKSIINLSKLNLIKINTFCDKVYEGLIKNIPLDCPDDILKELFYFKSDVRIIKLYLNREWCVLEYLTFCNQKYIGDLRVLLCDCKNCVVCKVFGNEEYVKMLNKIEETHFYETKEAAESFNFVDFSDFLRVKFDFFKLFNKRDVILAVLLGFTDQYLQTLVENMSPKNSFMNAFGLLLGIDIFKDTNDMNVVMETYDKLQDLLIDTYFEIPLDIERINIYYNKYIKINIRTLELNLSLKDLFKIFKQKINRRNHIRYLKDNNSGSFQIQNSSLPFSLIFIFDCIINHNQIPEYIVYEVYNKINKFFIPFDFYNKLFNNSKDHVIQLLRVKELVKISTMIQSKGFILQALKYLDKKQKDHKSFKVMKAKILLHLNQPSQAYLTLQKINTLDSLKCLAYYNLQEFIDKLKKVVDNVKSKLLSLELQVNLIEQLEIGYLFDKNSRVNEIILSQYKQTDTPFELVLACIRYLKHRDLKLALEYSEGISKSKKQKLPDVFYYEQFIIKRKLKKVSYRTLYSNRSSDLLNQEINYLENKSCTRENKFYYLFLYKTKRIKTINDFEYLIGESMKGNGDCLVILYLQYNQSIETLEFLYLMCSINEGFYWTRTRKIINFTKRLLHTIDIFEFDQNY